MICMYRDVMKASGHLGRWKSSGETLAFLIEKRHRLMLIFISNYNNIMYMINVI